jgi:hypothetical protein
VQRTDPLAGAQLAIGLGCALHRPVGQKGDDGVDLGVHALDLIQVRPHHCLGGHGPVADQSRQLGRRGKTEITAHARTVQEGRQERIIDIVGGLGGRAFR